MIEGSIESIQGWFLRSKALIESLCLCYWDVNRDRIIRSKFKKSVVTKNVNNTKKVKLDVSKLKAKKKYYIRVRTYKTVKVNGKSKKIYSGWSKVKAVTTKK